MNRSNKAASRQSSGCCKAFCMGAREVLHVARCGRTGRADASWQVRQDAIMLDERTHMCIHTTQETSGRALHADSAPGQATARTWGMDSDTPDSATQSGETTQ